MVTRLLGLLMLSVLGGVIVLGKTYLDDLGKKEKAALAQLVSQVKAGKVVEIAGLNFSPREITIKKDTTVYFLNRDIVGHSIVADDESFQIENLKSGENAKLLFESSGFFSYHLRGYPYIKGIILVE